MGLQSDTLYQEDAKEEAMGGSRGHALLEQGFFIIVLIHRVLS